MDGPDPAPNESSGDDRTVVPGSDPPDPSVERFVQDVQLADPRMRRLAYRMVGGGPTTDDVLQTAYAKAYRKLHMFRGEASFETWLYAIVYRTCLDHLRRRSREDLQDQADFDRTASDADAMAQVTDRLVIERALARLPPNQRAAIWLVDIEGLSTAAAGEALGLPMGTVGSRVSRGRSKLRELLAPDYGKEIR